MSRTIGELWEGYEARVIPADASEAQRAVMRQSFWAGAAAMFALVGSAGDQGEKKGILTMQALQKELKNYMAQMAKPRTN